MANLLDSIMKSTQFLAKYANYEWVCILSLHIQWTMNKYDLNEWCKYDPAGLKNTTFGLGSPLIMQKPLNVLQWECALMGTWVITWVLNHEPCSLRLFCSVMRDEKSFHSHSLDLNALTKPFPLLLDYHPHRNRSSYRAAGWNIDSVAVMKSY